jgi:hypothetical protein
VTFYETRARARAKQPVRACMLFVALLVSPGCREQPKVHAHAAASAEPAEEPARVQHVRAEGQLGPGGGTLLIDLSPPKGAKLTLDAPVTARGSGGIGLGFPRNLSGQLGGHELPLRLPIEVEDGATGPAVVELSYFWCTEGNEAACRREQARLSIDLDLTGDAAGGEAHVSYRPLGDKS